MSSFPAVATVIGLSKEVAESGPLLATLAIDPNIMTQSTISQPADIKVEDPVTQAVVDNIIGKLPTKKELVVLKCDLCNITVSSKDILETHYAGSKHARKVKGQELIQEIKNSPSFNFVATNNLKTEFTCSICNISVNSYQQLQQHLAGTKHKNKVDTNNSNTMQISVASSNSDKGTMAVNIRPNRLFCAACNIHVNSDLQLHQHITSTKHANKVNGTGEKRKRMTPYQKKTSTSQFSGKKNAGWSPNDSNFGLTSNWPMTIMDPNKQFVSGGMLSDSSAY